LAETKKGRGEKCLIEVLNRAGTFSPLVIARSATLITKFAIVVAVIPVIKLAWIVAAHSCLEVADAFAKSFRDFRYPARTEENNDYQNDD